MAVRVLYLLGFSHRLHGGRAARAHARLQGARPDGFSRLVAKFILGRSFAGQGQRDRIFTPWVTFCTFLAQVSQRDCGCRAAVKHVQRPGKDDREVAGGRVVSNLTTSCHLS